MVKSGLLMKIFFLLVLGFVQIFHVIACLPAYIFVGKEDFAKSAKNKTLTDLEYGFRRFFILTLFSLPLLYVGVMFVVSNFFNLAPPATFVASTCRSDLGGWDLFFYYYSPATLAVFGIGAIFFIFLMFRLGVFAGKKQTL